MVKFDGELTDPPAIDTSNPIPTALNWLGYAVVAGVAFVALGIASNIIAPAVGDVFAQVGLTSGEESMSGVPVSGEL